jgi:Uma2 family endonuclease
MSPAEYLERERKAEFKSEYFEGEMHAMAGANCRHALIVTNLAGELRQRLKKGPCKVYSSDLRLRVSPTGLYTYPDVTVVCGDLQFADDQKDTTEFANLDQSLQLPAIGCELPIAEVYDKVDLPGTP